MMEPPSHHHHGNGGGAANVAADAIWGAASLKERFGALSGRELQEHLFKTYQVWIWVGLAHFVENHGCQVKWI